MTDQLTSVDKRVRLPLGMTLLLGTAVAACARISSELPNTTGPVVDNGPRSADTSVAPIKPMLIDGNFVGADEIRKSCELKMGGSCEVFGIVFSNEKNIPKISPFVEHEGTNYVWGGPGKFDRLTQMPNEGKIQWADDNGFVYFVGIPEDGSITELKTLYYVDPDGKAWELQKPWGKLLASIVKPTPIPIETSTATPTAPATSTSTPTVAPIWTPTLKPLPTETKLPTATPKPTMGIEWHVTDGGNSEAIVSQSNLLTQTEISPFLDQIRARGRTTRKYNPNKPECGVGSTCYIVQKINDKLDAIWVVTIIP